MNRSATPFQALLHDLIGLTGRKVIVSVVNADGWPLLTVTGVITEGMEVAGEEPDSPDEVIYVSLDGGTDTRFVVARAAITDAKWHGPVLRIECGETTLEIET